MPSPAETSPAISTLTARVRKNLPSAERAFSLDVELNVAPGFNILFGPSGSGKTTLLDCIAGLVTPDAGRIAVGDRVLFDNTGAQGHLNIAVAQRSIGYVLQ